MRFKVVKTGLVVGTLLGLFHVVWVILVATPLAQKLVDLCLKIHFLNNPFQIQPFNFGTAVMTVVMTFVWGFVLGMILAFSINLVHKK